MSETTNVKATITIYKHSILTPEKNFALDNAGSGRSVETYLSSLTSQTIQNVNYIKQGLSIEVKLDKNQSGLEMAEGDKDWNYMKIQNGTENPLYYFIVNKQWIAKETIKFVLSMDTLNSFEYNVDYIINKKTSIQRQHKDRLENYGPHLIGNDRAGGVAEISTNSITVGTYTRSLTGTTLPFPGATGYLVRIVFDHYQGGVHSYEYVPYDYYTFSLDIENETIEVVVSQNYYSSFPQLGTARYMYVYPLFDLFNKKIDLLSEGINAPVYKTELGNLIDKQDNENWYLLYRNSQQQSETDFVNNSPVECYLIPEITKEVVANNVNGLEYTDFTDGKYYLFLTEYNGSFGIVVNGQTLRPLNENIRINNASFVRSRYYFIIQRVGTDLNWFFYRNITHIRDDVVPAIILYEDYYLLLSGTSTGPIETTAPYGTFKVYEDSTNPYQLVDYRVEPVSNTTITISTGSTVSYSNVSTVDRTDSRNIKLLSLPYSPSVFTMNSSGVFEFSSDWEYDSTTKWLKYKNLSKGFSNELSGFDLYNPFEYKFVDGTGFSPQNLRDDKYESKLWHSDYFRYKFVYDSFSRIYELEKYDFYNYYQQPNTFNYPENKITFVMTRTINSKFAFMFDNTYIVNSNLDYDNVCCVSRNNEEPLYNSAYINYIRAGYNYDKKSLERTTEANYLGIGLSIGSAILGVLGSVATWNPVPAIIGVAGAGLGIAGQLSNAIRTTAQGEQAIQQKLDETSRQAISVAGSDDIDLLQAYSGNRAKFVIYQVSERMKKSLGDLFYYCGYKTDLQGIPNKSSRYWFNFVQAELVINDTTNLPVDIEEDIKAKFSTGITFFHYRGSYNFEQDKENCEVSLL